MTGLNWYLNLKESISLYYQITTMNWITSTDIREWAKRRECQENLPLLVRKLIRSTTGKIMDIKFPSGDNVQMGGWDGILESGEDNSFVPYGISLWEFGATKGVKGKADDDYLKRTENPLGYDPKDAVFVFVTPHIWQRGEEWANEKRKEGKWKDVQVLNAEKLEEWIELAPAVGSWLSKHIGKMPPEGFQSVDEFWEAWSQGNTLKMVPELILAGRIASQDKLLSELKTPQVTAIKTSSREESIAFSIASNLSKDTLSEDFFSRALVVDDENTFRKLTNNNNSLILIARFEENEGLHYATTRGHNVIVPLGADSSEKSGSIVIPKLDRESFTQALEQMGLSKELSEKHSRESARSITVLRRQLEFNSSDPNWARPENYRDIVPAILMGRWDEKYEGDKDSIAELSGMDYDLYISKLSVWLHSPDSPVVRIGSSWRLTSPMDIWSVVSNKLTRADFNALFRLAVNVFKEVHPKFERPINERFISPLNGYAIRYSNWIREGVLQSLILTSFLGDRLHFDLENTAEIEVDNVIRQILSSNDANYWKSLSSQLPLIAEASPTQFCSTIGKLLKNDGNPVFLLFEEEKGFMINASHHSGLLWALEGLAWMPNYFSLSTLILAKLAVIDPGGELGNRPINSLFEIFKTWHYQTVADWETRMKSLELIAKKEPQIARSIIKSMMPDGRGVGLINHRFRWRSFDVETKTSVTYEEMYKTYSHVLDIGLSIYDKTENMLIEFIEMSVSLNDVDRKKIFSFVHKELDGVSLSEDILWGTMRGILNRHRSHPEANWALDEIRLKPYADLYIQLTPEDIIRKNLWILKDEWPLFVEGDDRRESGMVDRQEKLTLKRTQAAKEIYVSHGLVELIDLVSEIENPWFFGQILANFIESEPEVIEIAQSLNVTDKSRFFVRGFFFAKSKVLGEDWAFEKLDQMNGAGRTASDLVQYVIALELSKSLWERIENLSSEICNEYWVQLNPYFGGLKTEDKVLGINYLLGVKRFFSVLHLVNMDPDVPTDLLIEILIKAGTEKSSETFTPQSYEIERILKALSDRSDVPREKLIQLEWLYLPVISDYNGRNLPLLHEEMSSNPKFFIDIISWVYRPDSDDFKEDILEELTNEEKGNRALQASKLLESWKKVPGLKDGVLDEDFFRNWIYETRNYAEKMSRRSTADRKIGRILGLYPGNDPDWPGDFICGIIEEIDTNEIKSGFSMSISSKQSLTSRGAFDGGDIERAKADYYRSLADRRRVEFPAVTEVFDALKRRYLVDAKKMDEEAEKTRLDN